jgi:hypothetical protein
MRFHSGNLLYICQKILDGISARQSRTILFFNDGKKDKSGFGFFGYCVRYPETRRKSISQYREGYKSRIPDERNDKKA